MTDQQSPPSRSAPSDQNIEAIYPLTPMQEGMLYHSVYASQPGVYFQQATLRLRGPLDAAALRRAWELLLARYPILRSAFVWERLDRPLQVVRRRVDLPWQALDWRDAPPAEGAERLADFLAADRAEEFPLSKAPLMHLALIRCADDDHRLVWSHHHLLLDGWSTAIVLREAFDAYAALAAGREPDPAPTRPFRDYVAWLESRPLDAAESYWRQALAGFETPTSLRIEHLLDQTDAVGERGDSDDFGETRLRLSNAATARLRALAREAQVTLNTLVQGAWAILLSRYSGDEDVLFGATVAGRPAELDGANEMVGIFINTLPARVRVPPAAGLLRWLRDLQAQQAQAREYEHTPLVLAQGWSDVPRGQPLFETLVVFENYPGDNPGEGRWAGLDVSMERYFSRTNYPLTLTAYPGAALGLELTYARDRFDAASMDRLLAHLGVILESMAAQPTARLMDIPLLTEDERRRALIDWNDTARDFGHDAYIHQLFEAQARQTPDAVALVSPVGLPDAQHGVPVASMTYGELNERANRLAGRLRRMGVGPERVVALSIGRSMDMLVAVLAVLKAGGAYLPLDPSYPSERVAFTLADAGAHLVVTQQCFAPQFANLAPTVCVDEPLPDASGDDTTALPVEPDRLAYVVYTSGSTGSAKGVIVNHRSYVNAYRAWEAAYHLTTDARSHLQMANFSFDVFGGDWARALCSGGKLVLCPLDFLLAPDRLYALMRQEAVDCAEFVPVIMRTLLPYLEETGQNLAFMRILAVASDVWYVGEYWRIRSLCGPQTRLINSYGLSEATVDSSYYDAPPDALGAQRTVPIGRPFANTRLYILDGGLQPAPVGVPGELYVGGAGLARGYLNAPGLTAERFIPDPFAPLYVGAGDGRGRRLYRTGDLARYLPDGNIELLGRLDDQVKMRGMRVEPGEIVVTLSQHPAVLEAEVVLRGLRGGDAALVAYVVPRPQPNDGATPGHTPTGLGRDLRAYLAARLPAHMVPSRFVVLDGLPLTASGKVDRRALPLPDTTPIETGRTYVAPRDDIERRLAAIWQSVLHVEPVGVRDNFVELGGHSLLIVRMVAQVQKAFGVRLPLAAVLRAPTIEQLANLIREASPVAKEGAPAS